MQILDILKSVQQKPHWDELVWTAGDFTKVTRVIYGARIEPENKELILIQLSAEADR